MLFIICGVLSIFFGSIGALYQVKIKRMLAYSGVANFGYIILGLSSFSVTGYISVIYYIILYVINLTSIFVIFFILQRINVVMELKNVVEIASITH